MNIDFSRFPVYMSLKKDIVQEIDLKDQISNVIYMNGSGIALSALAMKIYNSDSGTDYNDKEIELLLSCENMFTCVFNDSLKDYINKHRQNNG